MTTAEDRHLSIDAVRGFAVLGILLMNIVSMGLPGFAYVDPSYIGGSSGPNLWTWATMFVVADGKMRTLFTLLYGASLVLIAGRAELGSGLSPVQIHYRRAFWLFVIGVCHHVFMWNGDILMFYAVAGAIAFPFRRLRGRTLIIVGLTLYLALAAYEIWSNTVIVQLRDAALAPGAGAEVVARWRAYQGDLGPPPSVLARDLVTYRGGFWTAADARFHFMILRHTVFSRLEYIEAFSLILAGMGLFRTGFFTLGLPTRIHAWMIALGLIIGIPLTAWMAWRIAGSGFDLATNFYFSAWSALPRLLVAAAYASVILLLVRYARLPSLIARLAAAGRMALTNYLASSLIGSLIFDGYGLGKFGYFERWQLYIVVLGVWAGCLLWSKPWLERFQYGPAEWVWRSLVQLKPQPMLRRAAAAPAVA